MQILDYGIEGTTPYIVMELLDGEDLDERLSRTGTLSLDAAYRILAQIGKALRRAHDPGIVHRDLKPGNVFLARSDDDEIVKILDFGIAKDISITGAATATSTGTMLGSPSYMSPEQIRESKEVDHRSDLWSVGVILYDALTGRVPFDESENIGKLLVSICTDPFPPPSTHVPALSKSVDAFFEKALARDKNARFQSMAELVDAFGVVAGVRPAQRSAPIGEVLPRNAALVDRSGTLGTDATLAVDSAVSAKSDAALPAPRPADVRSTLSPAERGSLAGSPRKRLVPLALAGAALLAAIGALVVAQTRGPADSRVASEPTARATTNGPEQTTTPSVSPGEALRSARASRSVRRRDGRGRRSRRGPRRTDGIVTISGTLGSTHPVRVVQGWARDARADVAIIEGGAIPAKLASPPRRRRRGDQDRVASRKPRRASADPARTTTP